MEKIAFSPSKNKAHFIKKEKTSRYRLRCGSKAPRKTYGYKDNSKFTKKDIRVEDFSGDFSDYRDFCKICKRKKLEEKYENRS